MIVQKYINTNRKKKKKNYVLVSGDNCMYIRTEVNVVYNIYLPGVLHNLTLLHNFFGFKD